MAEIAIGEKIGYMDKTTLGFIFRIPGPRTRVLSAVNSWAKRMSINELIRQGESSEVEFKTAGVCAESLAKETGAASRVMIMFEGGMMKGFKAGSYSRSTQNIDFGKWLRARPHK